MRTTPSFALAMLIVDFVGVVRGFRGRRKCRSILRKKFRNRKQFCFFGPKQTITENKIPIFEPDFPLDFRCLFSRLSVHFTVETRSVWKLLNFVMESSVMDNFDLISSQV